MSRTAEEFIALLGLAPHPEGGWFRFCGRSGAALPEGGGLRDSCSHIYYLLRREEISRWHRLEPAEVWTWHAGGSLEMTLGGAGALPRAGRTLALGPRLELGEELSILAPPGQWQTTRVTQGEFALVSCVVAPAYDDADCLLPPEPLANEIYPGEGKTNGA
ncbi:hypothetical protein SDC9_125519 [bioreactor metagenome]|uniref:DUF985 domain-containing protein n=1 Tax=bioreactor metagenome TaxID=1076179 RepID=A0A645CNM1_9ZZZZ